jgi:hypothetical protein
LGLRLSLKREGTQSLWTAFPAAIATAELIGCGLDEEVVVRAGTASLPMVRPGACRLRTEVKVAGGNDNLGICVLMQSIMPVRRQLPAD